MIDFSPLQKHIVQIRLTLQPKNVKKKVKIRNDSNSLCTIIPVTSPDLNDELWRAVILH
jgi:hypothetical protein